jgi:hypothetical protein
MSQRSTAQRILDFVSFPARAFILFHSDKWGLSSLKSERFEYVSKEVEGFSLDVGCGRHNRFVNEYLHGNGKGIDVDSERGMGEEEEYYLTDTEITERLVRAGFKRIRKKYFWTQWGLNHLFVGWKK